MEFKQQSWHAWYYQQFYAKDLPKSLCTYFWGLVLALLCLPLVYIFVIINLIISSKNGWKYYKSANIPGWIGIIASFCIMIAGKGICDFNKTRHITFSIWQIYSIGLICCLLFTIAIAIFAVIIYLIVITFIAYKEKRGYVEPKSNIFVEGIKSFFWKYCPKITWK